MGKHESQGSGQPAAADGLSTTGEATAASDALAAPTTPTAPGIGSKKKPDPYHAPHDVGQA